MPAITTISNAVVQDQIAKSVEFALLRNQVQLNQLEILDEQTLVWHKSPTQARQLSMNEKAFKSLLNIMNMDKKFFTAFNNGLLDHPEARSKMFAAIRVVLNQGGEQQVILFLNKQSKQIVNVTKANIQLISNESFGGLVESCLDRFNLDPVNYSVDTHMGAVTCTAVANNQFQVGNMKDEAFQSGIAFVNDPFKGAKAVPYMTRLVCVNGQIMTRFDEENALKLTGGDNGMSKFYNELDKISANNFMIPTFSSDVQKLMAHKASYAELKKAAGALRYAAPEISDQELESWIPVEATKAAYTAINVNIEEAPNQAKKNAATNINMWDLTNNLTFLASHEEGHGVNFESDYSRRVLQKTAGDLIAGTPDLSFHMPTPNWN